MTKAEKIQEAYGNWWEFYKDNVNENGWIKDREFWGKWPEANNITKIDWQTTDHANDYYDTRRPKSLQGIEDNHGWIKVINKCDLPKSNLDCWFENHQGTFRGYYNKHQDFFYDEKYEIIRKDITHYQPIEKPKPPIY